MKTVTSDLNIPSDKVISATSPMLAQPPVANWLTVERAIFGMIILLGAAIRFFQLTVQPLNLAEAANSWTAWLVASGKPLPMDAAPDSALLSALYTTIFWIFGGNDFVARTIPALCGLGLIWLLWYWRAWLGRTTVLIAALLIAVDPWFVAYSRLADSVALTLFLGMLTLTALLKIGEEDDYEAHDLPSISEDLPPLTQGSAEVTDDAGGQASDAPESDTPESDAANNGAGGNRETLTVNALTAEDTLTTEPQSGRNGPPTSRSGAWRQWAAIAFGLLLVSGPQMWNWLIVLALFVIFILPVQRWQRLLADSTFWLLAGGAALVGATGWLAYPEGVGALSTSLTVWLQSWSAGTAPYPLGWFWIRLITDQPLLIVFGLLGFGQLRGQLHGQVPGADGHSHRFFAFWLFWGLLLVLLPGRTPASLAMVGLPLLIFAATALAALWTQIQRGVAWRESGILLAVLAVLFVSGTFWFAAFSNNATIDNTLARTLLLIVMLMILLVVAYALWIDIRQARLVGTTGLAIICSLWTLSSMWALNHHFEPRYPDGFYQSFTDPDVRNLVDAVTMLSAQRYGDAGELALQVQMAGTPDPVLGWYLREMRNLQWVLAPGASSVETPAVVITLSEAAGATGLNTNYLGSSYTLREHWLPTALIATEVTAPVDPNAGLWAGLGDRLNALWSARIRNLWRWMIYHKVNTLPAGEHIILWVAAPDEAGQ